MTAAPDLPTLTVDDPAPRVVAVDMDGTFLDASSRYDAARFARIRERMDAAGVRFVVASGNQYPQLARYFTEPQRLAFVADNGSDVRDRGAVLRQSRFPEPDARRIIAALRDVVGGEFLASGPGGAYLGDGASEWFGTFMARYCPVLTRVGTLEEVADRVFKFSADRRDPLLPGELEALQRRLSDIAHVTSSGHRNIDVVVPGVNKAAGLELLTTRWGVPATAVAAFGDGGNDLEMLRWAGYGVAMANAPAHVRAAATHGAPGNDEAGVLTTLETWFG